MKANLSFLSLGAHSASQLSTWNIIGPHGKYPPHVHFSQSAKKESTRSITYYNRPWEIWTPPFLFFINSSFSSLKLPRWEVELLQFARLPPITAPCYFGRYTSKPRSCPEAQFSPGNIPTRKLKLSCWSLNARSVANKGRELIGRLTYKPCDLVAITET